MKAADIPDEVFLQAIPLAAEKAAQEYGWETPLSSASRWHTAKVLLDLLQITDIPINQVEKLTLAKAKRLIKKGIIDGCPCGCRGDFEIIKQEDE